MLRGVKKDALRMSVRFEEDGLMNNVRSLTRLLSHVALDVVHGVVGSAWLSQRRLYDEDVRWKSEAASVVIIWECLLVGWLNYRRRNPVRKCSIQRVPSFRRFFELLPHFMLRGRLSFGR